MVREECIAGEVTSEKSFPWSRGTEGPVKTGIAGPSFSPSPVFSEVCHTPKCLVRGSACLVEITDVGLLGLEGWGRKGKGGEGGEGRRGKERKAPGNRRYWEEGGLS